MNPRKNPPAPQKQTEPESNKKDRKTNKEQKMEQLTRSFFTRNKQLMGNKTDGEGKVSETVKRTLHFKSPSNENFMSTQPGQISNFLQFNKTNFLETCTERLKNTQTPKHSAQQSFAYMKENRFQMHSGKKKNCAQNYCQFKEKQNDVKVMNINLIPTKTSAKQKVEKKSQQKQGMFQNLNLIKK